MNSMTGYGRGEVSKNGVTVSIEIKSVNNRFLEINSRIPKSFVECDDIIKKAIQKKIKRGSVDVFFSIENENESKNHISVDIPLANEYLMAAKKLRLEFILQDDITTSTIMRFPDVIKQETSKDAPVEAATLTQQAVNIALDEICKMREMEGNNIHNDLKKLLSNVSNAVDKAIIIAPRVIEDFRAKLKARITEFLNGVDVDESRLLTEVAIFADKSDINEELSRLVSHLQQTFLFLDSDEQQGRKLDFLSQEINREVNTLGSKSNDVELTNLVVYMKNELEKIKEQIRNVE